MDMKLRVSANGKEGSLNSILYRYRNKQRLLFRFGVPLSAFGAQMSKSSSEAPSRE